MFSSSSSSDDEYEDVIRRPKIYNNRINHLNKWNDDDFFDRFRLTKPTVVHLLHEIENQIILPTNRGGCIQPMHQVLLTLRFYATGSMLVVVGDFLGVSKASASRIIERVSNAIASLRPRYVRMDETPEEMARTAGEFYRIARFPRVVGTIDCTHVRIQSPGGDDAEIYRNRKGYFSLNVQTVSDAKLKIRNIVARWPGSVHDQTIFNNSSLKRDFDNRRYENFILIGDSGYGIREYLMTPLQDVNTEAENLYNESLIRTRNTVERQYGVWKRRFPVLSLSIRLNIQKTMAVIVATAVLHNIAIDMNELPVGEAEFDEQNNGVEVGRVPENEIRTGQLARQLLINEHFARL